uniref:Ricin b lectin n=1 Tax=Colletotrichum fructicola (strain Nara gc5) TaxID=1213859 RepID=L2G235_COLFN
MAKFFILTAVLALASSVAAQCGSGTPDARVTGSGSSFTATKGSSNVYTGSDYRAAIQAALDSISSGQRVSVIASGSIGANTITIASGKIFEGCGTINVATRSGRGAIESTNTQGVQIPYLTMTGNPHAVETWNIDGLNIDQVIARNVGESGLLLQKTTNARVGLVDGNNVGAGTGYGTLRFANNNGQNPNGNYNTNVYIDKVVSRGGGFCVSQSGAAVITSFPNNRDIWITLKVDGTTVRESPCGENTNWTLTGNGARNIC